ncbi:PRC-barrel domain-containing protein [Horticoccus luteus]|uniref:PRC-barrel domain-containing protein n=1 Tax=Horticoccus luteus TaxID=2862869 RepID=A0A8F9XK22_9BACT|nr:PRC-barrel domain-containing protein [Horticoccus luteus]QYM77649.1 PRC-barrel domain-containing protein [Horticoccus luteus]
MLDLRSAKKLDGLKLHARDGEIGHVHDFYFDDVQWRVRYLVVETGAWLVSRKVLIAPEAVSAVALATDEISVGLTKDQVRNSPEIDTAKPVSRQHEVLLRNYYGWPGYWNGLFASPGMMAPALAPTPPALSNEAGLAAETHRPEPRGDPSLRSAREVSGYALKASDGELGNITDFIVDRASWRIRYLVVDTGTWWSGKKVLIAPAWSEGVDWSASEVAVELTRAQVKSSPVYDPEKPLSAEYADRLHDHYERPRFSETASARDDG